MRLAIFYGGSPLSKDGEGHRSQASLFLLLNQLGRHFDIDLIAPVSLKSVEGGYKVDRMRVHSIPSFDDGFDLYFRKFIPSLYRLAKIFRLHSSGWDAFLVVDTDPLSQACFALARQSVKPTIVYLRGDAAYEVINRNRTGARRLLAIGWARWLAMSIPFMLRRSLGVITGSALAKRYSVGALKIVSIVATSVSDSDIETRRATTPPPPPPYRLLSVGNLASVKGIDRLINAAKILVEEGIDITLAIAGDGPERPALERQAAEARLTDRVRFYGKLPFGESLFDLYRQAHLFVLPSRSEGTPKALSEALSFGLPVVAAKVGGVPDVIQEKENGLLVDPCSPETLARTIRSLFDDRALYETLRQDAFRTAANNTLEKVMGQVAKEIKAFVAAGGRAEGQS